MGLSNLLHMNISHQKNMHHLSKVVSVVQLYKLYLHIVHKNLFYCLLLFELWTHSQPVLQAYPYNSLDLVHHLDMDFFYTEGDSDFLCMDLFLDSGLGLDLHHNYSYCNNGSRVDTSLDLDLHHNYKNYHHDNHLHYIPLNQDPHNTDHTLQDVLHIGQ